MTAIMLAVAVQLQIPAPVGFVNDFAGIVDPTSQQVMQSVIEEVRQKSGGEIVVVTMRDLGGRASIDVARDIGREWGVGAQGGPGDRARNAGVVLLLVHGERPGDGKAELAIATGTGAEGFVTDATSGRIRDAIGRAAVENESYAAGLVAGVWFLGQTYAREFEFELTGEPTVRVPDNTQQTTGPTAIIVIILVIIIVSLMAGGGSGGRGGRYGRRRYRGSGLAWLVLGSMLGGGRGGGHWGGGGFGGGGFGGFGGGGGFSGGGASGRF